jgi:hypothetical protein
MRTTLCATCAAVLLITVNGFSRADDQADVRKVVDKAIKAHGGEQNLAKYKASSFKMKGKYYGMGEGIDYTAQFAAQLPKQIRFQIDLEVQGMQVQLLQIVNGDKGWIKLMDNTMDMDEDTLKEAKESLYSNEVERLVPLIRDKGFKLAPLGESKVGDKAVVGIRVSREGHRDINLFFDKASGLTLKTERVIKDPMAGGKEVTETSLYSDYKAVDGVQYAAKTLIQRDGQKYVEGETTNFKPAEKLDESMFAKP